MIKSRQESLTSLTGSILRFERASIHDGQGLRTVLFLKGCPLHCPWCSTPESRNLNPQRGYNAELCSLCGNCISACPEQALTLSAIENKVIIDQSRCKLCFKCAAVCPQNAIKKYGLTLSVAETVEQIRKDEIFYFHSSGGLTISGGEPFWQPEFTAAVLEQCKKLGIHTAVESCLHVPYPQIELSLPWLDHLYADLKQMDSRLHQLLLGEDNSLILENIKKINHAGQSLTITIRLPLIPGFNDSDQNLKETVQFCVKHSRVKEIEVLPYHRLGSDTYRHLGLDYQCRDLIPPSEEYLAERVSFMRTLAGSMPVKTGSGLI
jgi:pyruvate formate lyase activating enzyme